MANLEEETNKISEVAKDFLKEKIELEKYLESVEYYKAACLKWLNCHLNKKPQ